MISEVSEFSTWPKMLMYMKQMLMYTRKDCPMKFHFCTSPRTSNEFDVHQNHYADAGNVQEVGGLTNEGLCYLL